MKIIQTELSNLVANDYNPNSMPEGKMEQLKKTIKTSGYWQFIIARPHPTEQDKYLIIDGEHRWKAMLDEPEFQGPQNVIVVDSAEDEARIQTINFNHIRGEMDSVKMANIIHKLVEDMGLQEVEALLGMTIEEITSYNEMANFDFNEYGDIEDSALPEEEEEEEVGTEVSFILSQEEVSRYLAMSNAYGWDSIDNDKDTFIAMVDELLKGVSTVEQTDLIDTKLSDEAVDEILNA